MKDVGDILGNLANRQMGPRERSAYEAAARRKAEEAAAGEAAREVALVADLAEQTKLGRVTLVPFPEEVVRRRVLPFRSELTLEHATLFASNDFKGPGRVVVYDPETNASVRIGQTNDLDTQTRGALLQRHQEVFYRLLALWQEKGYPLQQHDGKEFGFLVLSAYQLVRAIRKSDSEHDYKMTQKLLRDLSGIPIVLEGDNGTRSRVEFTLLGEVAWDERQVDKKTKRPGVGGKSEVTIRFSSFVTEGFKRKNVKQLLGGPYFAIRGALGRLLYAFLDSQLAGKPEYHCKLEALAEKFGLARLEYKSDRRKQFKSAVKELNGKLILGERFQMSVVLKSSSDDTDWVFIAERTEPQQLPLPFEKKAEAEGAPASSVSDLRPDSVPEE